MPRKTLLVVLAFLLFLAAAAEAGMPFRRRSAGAGHFPDSGDVPDLARIGKVLTYKSDEKFLATFGEQGKRYQNYGLIEMMSAEYTYGGKDRRVTIEIATMESPTAAAGIFHYNRGNVLEGRGTPLNVGSEGVLDSGRDGRTVYFYRGLIFVKIVYSGREPVPDLTPIAAYIDGKLPAGADAKPEGLSYIELPGVNKETVAITPGFTFNYSFLPPSVWASAPAGGSVASDLFIVTTVNNKAAAEVFKDYVGYLKLYAEYHEEYSRGKQRFMKAVDPAQGRVVFTAYKNALIIAARPDGYEKGEELIDRVMARIDEVNPGGRRK